MNSEVSTSGTWVYGAAILLVIVIGASGLYMALSGYFKHEELGSREYYATLQMAEFENRGNRAPNPILKENFDGSGLNILGVPSGEAEAPKVWIILNKVSADEHPLMIPWYAPAFVDG
ncbi:hypothetical protein KK141_09230 [Dyella sp. LX-66]|uniref:hypothetical protein n=1 Tax=unclassified Dyella TaxID=2634549 RepID=UPI001BDF9C7B|nr:MULTISPECIES: hypothetical protein [unclassified Dyella]MBT2115900.1 hypothetical protein [Dyella sp. LX-1]MBT2139715.1 hypothetical protein [Dyella sp. LX-66]